MSDNIDTNQNNFNQLLLPKNYIPLNKSNMYIFTRQHLSDSLKHQNKLLNYQKKKKLNGKQLNRQHALSYPPTSKYVKSSRYEIIQPGKFNRDMHRYY